MQQTSPIMLALYFDRNHIGLSLFDQERVRIQCSCLFNLCYPAYSIIKRLVAQCSRLLCNNSSHEIFSHFDLDHVQLQIIPEKSFEAEIIQHMLTQISAHMTVHKNPKAFVKMILQNRIKCNSLGMLLTQILHTNHHSKLYLEDIDYFIDSLLLTVQYNKKQLQFLEICKEDIHPSLIKGQGNSKEGYSVISAYQSFLISTGSKRILRYIFTNPTYDQCKLTERQERIYWMKQHMRDSQKYNKYFRNIHVLESILKKYRRMNVEEEQWRKLLNTMESMLQIRNLVDVASAPPLITEYVNDPNWQEVKELFNVFKSTLELSPLSIKNGIDGTLDHLKRTFDNMSHILTLIAKQQAWPIEFSIVFMTQVGYLIKISHNSELPPEMDSTDWTLEFSNNSGNFYSNNLTQSLDSQYGDLYGQIQDIQKKIIFDMESLVIQRENILLDLYWRVCQIECYWGISQLSKGMCQPRMSSEALIISNGWHLLLTGNVINNHTFSFPQSQAPKRFVNNSQRNLVNERYSNRCSVITGPNASGKTVYMKQLGIIVYLAHLGMFVPASFAQIPLIDSINFVGKAESIYTDQRCGCQSELLSLSSVAQPNIISNKALVLIDELGAQVDYENALKLLYTTIDYLTNICSPLLSNHHLSQRSDEFKTPLVFIITHLSEILRSNVLEQNYLIRFLTMSVEPTGLRLFKIKPGLVAKGYGIKTASQILPQKIISSSQKYLSLIQQI